MPIYEYSCQACGNEFELLIRGQEKAACPKCKSSKLERAISRPSIKSETTHALAMAQRAQQAGKACAIGSNLETDLGQAPNVCLAASLSAFPVARYACDLMGSLFYAVSAVTPPIRMEHGRVALPKGPGFGVIPNV